ncbi:type IV pilin N-terminal domain-containing protein [Methanococcoides sp.]|jgi:flagellin-like protein|uniref:type IV pilin N-terminal domain-containing protein n=1 Tax=Methanococcoides sp. TaxID=1966350 RepID=UPI0019F68FEC|nr:type IV pilin N-terminal domain-containing protein [Methanococcoides sp.]NOQ48608.1 type IV pilin [Methanococcoides sp.]
MKRKMKLVNDSRAVSPVIGVMLMIVVTVVLAAAVSSSSQGILDGAEQAPSAVFSVEIVKDIDGNMGSDITTSYISIRHVSGDSIDTSDISIITINPNARGDNGVMEVHPNVVNTHVHSEDYNYIGTAPFWNQGGFFDTQEHSFFGEFILEPGRSMMADEWSNYEKAIWDDNDGEMWMYRTSGGFEVKPENDGHYITGMQAMFADWDSVRSGDHVTVKIIHNPSQKVIFDSEVRVI